MFKMKIKFLILFALFIAAAYIEGGPLFYRISYGFAAAIILSAVVVFLNKRYLNIDILFNRNVYSAGDSGRFDVVLNNKGILPISYLVVVNSSLKKLSSRYNGDAVSVGALSSKSLKYEVKFRNRGIYNFGDMVVSFKDTASIIESKSSYISKALVHVYPKIVALDPSLFRGINLFNNYKLSSNGMEDVYTIRDNRKYRNGDNLKRINWKVSAKLNDLYVRNHEVLVGEEFNLFLDMNSCNYQIDGNGIGEEELIDTCASAVHFLTKRKIISKLFVNAATSQSFTVREPRDFQSIMEYFIATKSDSSLPFVNFLKMHLIFDASMKNIALITPRVDNNLLEFVMDLEERRKNLFIFYNQVVNKDGVNIIKLRKLGVKVIDASQIIR